MKKTLVALVVTAFAASASAVTVYDNEGTKVNVNGRVNVSVKNETKDGKRTDLHNEGSRVTFAAQHQIAEGFKGLANLEIRPDFEGNVKAARVWAGLSADQVGTLTFGKQLTNGDGVGLSDFTNLYGGVNQLRTGGNKVVKFTSAEFGGFSFGADYLFGESKRGTKPGDLDKYRNGVGVALFYKNKFSDDFTFKSNAGFTHDNVDFAGHESKARQAMMFAVGGVAGPVEFGVDFSQLRDTSKTDLLDGLTRQNQLELGAQYNINPSLNVYTAVKFTNGRSADKSVKEKGNEGILGATYFFHKNVRTYVEGALAKTNITDNGVKSSTRENKVGVGFRVDF